MPRIRGLSELGRHPSWRLAIERRRGALAQHLVGALVVVYLAEAVESGLLIDLVPLRRAGGFRLERPVHAFMTAVLLRPSRLNPLVPDAELDPPDTQLREAAEGRRGKGRAVRREVPFGLLTLPRVTPNRACVSSDRRLETSKACASTRRHF
jgi:hypothetical protein